MARKATVGLSRYARGLIEQRLDARRRGRRGRSTPPEIPPVPPPDLRDCPDCGTDCIRPNGEGWFYCPRCGISF